MSSRYRVSDLIADFLIEIGTRHVFILPGGGNMYLIDGLKKNKKINTIPCHHEQTTSIAAEAYTRVSQKIGVAVVTSGPGSTNAITGVVGSWIESSPLIVISGQVKTKDLMKNNNLRQNGVQEVNIVKMIDKVTKFSITIKSTNKIIQILNKAYDRAISGRPGPVWIDIPLDIQGKIIKKPKRILKIKKIKDEDISINKIKKVEKLLLKSSRPVFLIGHGARISKSKENFLKLIKKLNIPCLFTWNTMDFLPFSHKLNYGRPGNVAIRSSNFIIQNSDLLISIGCKLDNIVTAYNPKNFAPYAKKVYVNIDQHTYKNLKLKINIFFKNDANRFIIELGKIKIKKKYPDWIKFCDNLKEKYKLENEKKFHPSGEITHYQAVNALSKYIPKNKIIATGSSGLAIEQFYTFFKNKINQRIFLTSGLGSMGFGIPASIGASFGSKNKEMFLVEGDGSFHMNLQDLAVISKFNLPICIFIFNNNGYASIRNTQKNYFKNRYCGTGPEANLSFPNYEKICKAYKIKHYLIKDTKDLIKIKFLANKVKYPKLVEIKLKKNEILSPKVSALIKPDKGIISMPIEDMSPLLKIDELKSNLLIPLSKSSLLARDLKR